MRKKSVADRVQTLPFVNVRPQDDAAQLLDLDGPEAHRVGLMGTSNLAPADHLVVGQADTRSSTLCGVSLHGLIDRWGGGKTEKICQGCRVEASRLRARIVR